MTQQINLYSSLFRKQNKLFTSRAMLQALVLILVALAVLYTYARFQVGVLARQANELDSQVRAGLERAEGIPGAAAGPDEKQLDARLVELESRLQAAEQFLGQAGARGSSSGYADPLRALARQRQDGVWLTSIILSGEGAELTLTGHALRPDLVPQYIEGLTKDPAMRGRRFATLAVERDDASKTGGSQVGSVTFRLSSGAAEEK